MKENQLFVLVLLASIGLLSDPEERISRAEFDVQDPESAARQVPGEFEGFKKDKGWGRRDGSARRPSPQQERNRLWTQFPAFCSPSIEAHRSTANG